MKNLVKLAMGIGVGLMSGIAVAHYPYVAPLSYQAFNNHTTILSGFYDNPFASEVAIKNFKFHVHTPDGGMLHLTDADWSNSRTVSSYSLENKVDGTYRIRALKHGATTRFALDGKVWKTLINAEPKLGQTNTDKVVYAQNLKKNASIKTVQSVDILETFVSRNNVSNKVIHHIHSGFDVQFVSHPNAFKANENIQLKVLDDQQGIAKLNVEILAQTTDFSREEKVYKTLMTNDQGELNFSLAEKGQYLLKVDYQQPFTNQGTDLKRYKYTLAFNVI